MVSKSFAVDVYLPHHQYAHVPALYFVEALLDKEKTYAPNFIEIIHREEEYRPAEGSPKALVVGETRPYSTRSIVYDFPFTNPQLKAGSLGRVSFYQGDFRESGFCYSSRNLETEVIAPRITAEMKDIARTIVKNIEDYLLMQQRQAATNEQYNFYRRLVRALDKIKP